MRAYLLLLFTALAITMILVPVMRRLALSFNILTPLRGRDIHAFPTPRLGGLAMTGGVVGALLLANLIPFFHPIYAQSSALWSVLLGTVAIASLGAIDDIWDLDWLAKLTGQILITGGMAIGGVQLINLPIFGVTIGSSRMSVFVSVVILVAVINAVNFIDGLDGLAAGVIAIGSLSFFAYSYLLTRLIGAPSYATTAAIVTVILAGATIGFLWFNFHPASIFMGDSGSMVLGLLLGSAAITVTGQVNPAILTEQSALTTWVPVLIPFAVLVIPLVDLLVTPALRVLRGKSPVTADRTHLHHRLLSSGHSHRGVVLILYSWTALTGITVVSFIFFPSKVVALVMVPLLLLTVFATVRQFPGRCRKIDGYDPGAGPSDVVPVLDDGQEVISRPRSDLVWFPLRGKRNDGPDR